MYENYNKLPKIAVIFFNFNFTDAMQFPFKSWREKEHFVMTTETALSKTEERNLFLVNPVKVTDVSHLAVLRPTHLQLSVGFHCFRESRLRPPSIVELVNFYQPICNNGPVLFYPSLILQCPLKFIGSGNDAKSDTVVNMNGFCV